jgi:rhodanese-related sulfurtransferase
MSSPVDRVDPEQAHALMRRTPGAVLLDVRSRVEFDYVGHPPGALHVAWKEFPDWSVNPAFAEQVTAALKERGIADPRATPVFAICRSGGRSMAAAEELARHGYKTLYNVEEGFEGDPDSAGHRNTVNGWRVRGLPWEQT